MREKTVRLDRNAYELLTEVKNVLRDMGINATYSDAVRWLYELYRRTGESK